MDINTVCNYKLWVDLPYAGGEEFLVTVVLLMLSLILGLAHAFFQICSDFSLCHLSCLTHIALIFEYSS